MNKPILVISVLSLLGISTHSISAYAEDINPIEAAWMLRSTLPQKMSKLYTLRELMSWCEYEDSQPHPNKEPCELVQSLAKGDDIKDTVQLIKATLKNLETGPQTLIVKEHTAALKSALEEIKYNLRPMN